MSGYSNMNEGDLFWNPQGESTRRPYPQYDTDYNVLQSQALDFQSFGENQQYYSFADLSGNQQVPVISEPFSPNEYFSNPEGTKFDEEEPPLLEELEIYPERIMEKMLLALVPFRDHRLADDSEFLNKGTDLAGPLAFCIILAISLFISGSKIYFGYIYGLSAMSCLMMYCLLTLMTTTNNIFSLANVTSVLGYSLLPIVGLSVFGVFMSLHGLSGIIISTLAVLWSSLSASRLFISISGDSNQRILIAYPCALVCGVFALLVIF